MPSHQMTLIQNAVQKINKQINCLKADQKELYKIKLKILEINNLVA